MWDMVMIYCLLEIGDSFTRNLGVTTLTGGSRCLEESSSPHFCTGFYIRRQRKKNGQRTFTRHIQASQSRLFRMVTATSAVKMVQVYNNQLNEMSLTMTGSFVSILVQYCMKFLMTRLAFGFWLLLLRSTVLHHDDFFAVLKHRKPYLWYNMVSFGMRR